MSGRLYHWYTCTSGSAYHPNSLVHLQFLVQLSIVLDTTRINDVVVATKMLDYVLAW